MPEDGDSSNNSDSCNDVDTMSDGEQVVTATSMIMKKFYVII